MISVEEKLKELILCRYKSLREFTVKIGMPYSTFDTILKRGVDKANIINILKICDELKISADKLANGVIENKIIDFNSLDIESMELVNNFNKLNDLGKNAANKRVAELTEIAKYSYTHETNHNDESYIPTTFAAHDDSDPEIAKHDADVARKFLSKIKKK